MKTRAKSGYSSKGKTILIAEDDLNIREELAELLQFENYKTVSAANGKQLLELIRSDQKIDLYIIDKKMPDIDGLECIEIIRQAENDTPILLATGSIPDLNDVQLEKLNINRFLKKPYSFDKLVELIKELI
jgi:two-component system response regulator AtoC